MKLSPDNKTLLEVYFFDMRYNKFTIPNSVTHIGNGAFSNGAFRACTGLTQVSIPNSVTHIGNGAFRACTGLTQVTIPNSVTHIGEYAFEGCTGLTQVSIPNSVTHIGEDAFKECTGLTQVTIPNSVTHIYDGVFSYCSGLTKITIPNSVTHIGINAFYKCANPRMIVIEAPNEEDYMRIRALVPQESRYYLIIPFMFVENIKVAKEQALMSMAPMDLDLYLPRIQCFSEGVSNQIYKYDERFHDVLNQVLLPGQLDELRQYEKALKKALSQFWQEQIAISKLLKVITKTEEAIDGAKKIPGFFDSPEKKSNLKEGLAHINVTRKLIQWLDGDKTVLFTLKQKDLLSKPRDSVALILNNHGINLEQLPIHDPTEDVAFWGNRILLVLVVANALAQEYGYTGAAIALNFITVLCFSLTVHTLYPPNNP